MSIQQAKPFLKWAGGKGQILQTLEQYFHQRLQQGRIRRYVEPFLGGGAMFFYLQFNFDFEQIVLNDINPELKLTYYVVQNNINSLVDFLSSMESEFLSADEDQRKTLYYKFRQEFNEEKAIIDYQSYSDIWIKHASKMIFLNRTCFNGLYRQNRKGQFNVPIGAYKNPTICDEENLLSASEALQGVTLISQDFESLTPYVDENTFVYMDPPYRPLSGTSSFNEYAKEPFNDESQIRLSKWFKTLDEKGASLMLSNSDPTNTNPEDIFFDELYNGFNIFRIDAIRAINSKASGRGTVKELVITNNK